MFALEILTEVEAIRQHTTRRQTGVLSLLGVPLYRPARSDEAIYQTNNNVEIAGTVQRSGAEGVWVVLAGRDAINFAQQANNSA